MFTNRNYLRTRFKNRQRKKFFPGHYLYGNRNVDTGLPALGSSADANYRQRVVDDPNFVGYHVHYYWQHLEPSRGVYDFSKILEDLEIAKNDGKVLTVEILERTWGGEIPFFVGPSYMDPASPNYDSDYAGMYFNPPNEPWRLKPNLWKPLFGDRMVELINALGPVIDDHPALALFGFNETANVGMPDQPGFTGEQYLTYLKRIHTAAAVVFKNTLVHQTSNWFEGMTPEQGEEFVKHLIEVCRGTFGAADIIGGLDDVLKPVLQNGFGEYYIKYRDVAPIVNNAEYATYAYGPAQRQFDYAVDTLGANIVRWQPAQGWNPGEEFDIDDVIAVIDAENGRVNPNIPSNLLT
jgi:hypothetical protein